jgi:MFS family permease
LTAQTDAGAGQVAAVPAAGRATIFADASFRRLWAIGAINSVMRWMEMVAVSVFVYDLTGSPWSLALVGFFRALPMLTFGVFFGAVADRVDRRRLLAGFTAMLTAVYVTLGVLVIAHRIELWHIMLGAFLVGTAWATDFPVRRNMVADIVGRSRISTAIGIDQATQNISRIIGPTVAGVFVQWIGVEAAYFTGAVLYLGATVLAATVAYRAYESRQAPAGNPLSNIAEGLRFVRSSDVIIPTLVITIIVNVFVFPYTFVVPAIAKEELHIGPVLLGVLTSVEGVGATIGSVLVATRARAAFYTRAYFFGSCVFALMALTFAGVQWYWVALPVVLISGLGMSGFGSMQSIIILNATPAALRGRVLGVLTVCIGAGPLGALQIGWLAEKFGPSTGVAIIGGTGLALTALAALIWPNFVRTRKIELAIASPPGQAMP